MKKLIKSTYIKTSIIFIALLIAVNMYHSFTCTDLYYKDAGHIILSGLIIALWFICIVVLFVLKSKGQKKLRKNKLTKFLISMGTIWTLLVFIRLFTPFVKTNAFGKGFILYAVIYSTIPVYFALIICNVLYNKFKNKDIYKSA